MIHLELVQDQTIESFLLALRRFTARRGIRHVIYSYNAPTFKRAAKYLSSLTQAMDSAQVHDHLATHRIQWKFIVEQAAWWGGWWERMVRTVKTMPRNVLGRASLSNDALATMVTEIEVVLNSQPITYQDCSEVDAEALTPAHFLVERGLNALPHAPASEDTLPKVTGAEYRRRFQYRQRLVETF